MQRLAIHAVLQSWNNNFIKAEADLRPWLKLSPRHILHNSEIISIRQMITGRIQERDLLFVELDKVDRLASSLLQDDKALSSLIQRSQQELLSHEMQHKEGIDWAHKMSWVDLKRNWRWDIQIVAADAILWRAIFQLGGGQEIFGAFNLRRGWKSYEALQTEINNAKKAKIMVDEGVEKALEFGVGLFYFLVSIVPGTFLTLLEVIGFKANRELGVSILQQVHQHAGIRSPMAALVLLMNYLFIPRALSDVKELLGNAEPIIKDCLAKMPNGTMFLLMASHFARKTGEVDDAIPYLNKAISECERMKLPPNNYMFELGLCHYMKLDWAAASAIFEQLVNDDKNQFEMKPMACIQLSSCYIATGREEEAWQQLRRVPSLLTNKSNRFAKIAKAKAERILKRRKAPFLAFDFLYLRRDMAHMGRKNLERSLKLIESLEPTTVGDVETLATYILLLGANLKFLGRNDEALSVLYRIKKIEHQVIEEKYTVPYSYYEIGEILYKTGQISQAEEAFRSVQNYRGAYDFSDVLKNRVRLCFVQIKKDKEAKQKTY